VLGVVDEVGHDSYLMLGVILVGCEGEEESRGVEVLKILTLLDEVVAPITSTTSMSSSRAGDKTRQKDASILWLFIIIITVTSRVAYASCFINAEPVLDTQGTLFADILSDHSGRPFYGSLYSISTCNYYRVLQH